MKLCPSQLFGEPDADQDVVPDQNDPELQTQSLENGNKPEPAKINIRSVWKVSNKYEAHLLLKILFRDSIADLLAMTALWTKADRVKPVLLDEECIAADPDDIDQLMSIVTGGVKDQEKLSLSNWCQVFKKSAKELATRISGSDSILSWDKDDVVAMDFVAAAANIRMSVFHILPMLTRFEIKSMAGNIIPAIATTNAMIAGISVLHAYKILNGQAEQCLDVMVSDFVSARGKIIQAVQPLPPVPDCYVCSNKLTLSLVCRHPNCVTLKILKTAILESRLKMRAPNVGIQNKSSVIIDGDDDEDADEAYLSKTLDQFELAHGAVLRCSDFLQTYEFNIELKVCPELVEGDWQLVGDVDYVIGTAVADDASENAAGGGRDMEEEDSVSVPAADISPARTVDRKRKYEEESSEHELRQKIVKLDPEIVANEEDDSDDDDLVIIE